MKKPAISIKNTEKAKNEPALLKIASAAAAAKYGGLVPRAGSARRIQRVQIYAGKGFRRYGSDFSFIRNTGDINK